MSLKAIIHGRNCLLRKWSSHKNQTVTIYHHILGCEGLLGNSMSDAIHSAKSVSDHTAKGVVLENLPKHQVLAGFTGLGSGKGRSGLIFPLGSSSMWQTLRYGSTSTARRPDIDSGNENEDDQDRPQERKALMEDCADSHVDQGMEEAKSGVKGIKKSHDTSMKQEFWARVHGIGPAIKVVASMSRLFPNMVPSTFKDKMKEQEALKRKLKARMEYARFLQDIVKEMAKEVKFTRSGEIKQRAVDIDRFIKKVRTGAYVDNDEILGFAKLFNDELTLENMSRSSLVHMCKYMGIQPYGTNNYLRFMLRRKLKCIKDDDMLIQREGIGSLSEHELRQACMERGHLGSLSIDEMREELQDWLDLSLNYQVPSSLLILSRAFTVSGKMKAEDVRSTLSSLPDGILGTICVSLPSENALSARKRKLEFLKMQDKLVKEEQNKPEGAVKLKGKSIAAKDGSANQLSVKEAGDLARKRMLEKQEELCQMSQALALLSTASSVSKERQEFLSLVSKEIELYNSLLQDSTIENAKDAYISAKGSGHGMGKSARSSVSSALMGKINAMLQELTKEIDDVDTAIGDGWQLLDRDHDGKVTAEEVAAAASYLKHNLDNAGIEELIRSLSKDREGKILVEDIIKLGTQAEETDSDEE